MGNDDLMKKFGKQQGGNAFHLSRKEVFGGENNDDSVTLPPNFYTPPSGGMGVDHYDPLDANPYPYLESGAVLREMFGAAVGEWDGF